MTVQSAQPLSVDTCLHLREKNILVLLTLARDLQQQVQNLGVLTKESVLMKGMQ